MNERDRKFVTAYVALGSNLGRREDQLKLAVRRLDEHPQVIVQRASPVYETPAHTLDPADSAPAFLNAVLEVSTTLQARELLEFGHQIERKAGRDRSRSKRWSPRTLDLDILIYGSQRIEEEGLSIPHPRLHERRFVLRPLADLTPDLRIPDPYESSVRDLLDACSDLTQIQPVELALADEIGRFRE